MDWLALACPGVQEQVKLRESGQELGPALINIKRYVELNNILNNSHGSLNYTETN